MNKNTSVTYPYHEEDGGALLPLMGGGLVCGRCHKVIESPGFVALRQAREAHEAAGEKPLSLEALMVERAKPTKGPKLASELMFDLGPPDPAAELRVARRKGAAPRARR
jgi:hypothetical protein